MIFRLLITLFSTFVLCSCNSTYPENSTPSGEISIAHLKSLCKGDHYRIVNDYYIKGIVVATDSLGELHNSAVIVDRSGGVEIAIELDNIAELFPIYSEVKIFCNGLSLARIGGKIELGATPTGSFPIDNINKELIDRHIHRVGMCEEFRAITKQFSEIGVADISAIVRFDNIRLCEEERGLTWCDIIDNKPTTTYRTFIDSKGDAFAIRTLSTCHYAIEEIPTKELSAVGVIDYSGNRYFLRIVNKWIIE